MGNRPEPGPDSRFLCKTQVASIAHQGIVRKSSGAWRGSGRKSAISEGAPAIDALDDGMRAGRRSRPVCLSGHEHNYDDVRRERFFGQTRRERRAYPSGVCEEQATKSGRKRTAALRVAPNLACGGVARRSQIHEGYSPSSRLAVAPNLQQRTLSLFM